jgi:hypothetical protein
MGTVNRVGRLALVSILAGAALAACGSPAPTSSFQTKQIVPLAGWGWAEGALALNASVAAAISEIQPVTTNIVGTSPWLGFPGPAAFAAGLASPWPTFAGNIGTASVLNAQMGYILGLGPLGVPLADASLIGVNAYGLAAPAGLLGYAGLPFINPLPVGAPVGAGMPIGAGMPPVAGMPPAGAGTPVDQMPPQDQTQQQQPQQQQQQQPQQPQQQQPQMQMGQGS